MGIFIAISQGKRKHVWQMMWEKYYLCWTLGISTELVKSELCWLFRLLNIYISDQYSTLIRRYVCIIYIVLECKNTFILYVFALKVVQEALCFGLSVCPSVCPNFHNSRTITQIVTKLGASISKYASINWLDLEWQRSCKCFKMPENGS